MAEKDLVPFLWTSRDPRASEVLKGIKSYKRQYVGIIIGGHKQIYINSFCDPAAVDWTRKEIVVADGGPCYFSVRFSNKTKTFSHLQINGLA